jgi:hypothetical protein
MKPTCIYEPFNPVFSQVNMKPAPIWIPGAQVGEYFPDHRRVFDTGDDPDITTAFAAGFDIDIEHAFQSLCPCH